MINYRTIFNPSYNYIGLIFIIALSLLIILVQKDMIASVYQISKISFISGIIIIIITLIINFIINNLIPNTYKIFIQVISDNVVSNLFLMSSLVAVIGGCISLMTKILIKKNHN